MLQPTAVERSQKTGRGLIVQMAVAPGNARLQRLWVVPVHQHNGVVIAFEHQRIAAGESMASIWLVEEPVSVSTPRRCAPSENMK